MTRGKVEMRDGEREEIESLAVEVFNRLFEGWHIQPKAGGTVRVVNEEWDSYDPDRAREMTRDDIKMTQTWKLDKAGHLGRHESGEYWKLGVDVESWRRKVPANRLAFLIHELAHTVHADHSERFWETAAEATTHIAAHRDALEAAFDGRLRPDTVKDFVGQGITVRASDTYDDPEDQREAFCAVAGYNPLFIGAFHQVNVNYTNRAVDIATAEVPVTSIDPTHEHPDRELFKSLRSSSHDHDHRYVKINQPPRVAPDPDNPGAYVAKSGWIAVSLLQRLYHQSTANEEMYETVKVRIVDEEMNQLEGVPDGYPGTDKGDESAVTSTDCIEAVERVAVELDAPPTFAEVASRHDTPDGDHFFQFFSSWESVIRRSSTGHTVEDYRTRVATENE